MDELEHILRMMVGLECWAVITGRRTSFGVGYHFGKRILRRNPIASGYLSDERRRYRGEYRLITTCNWRLDSKQGVVCGSYESLDADGSVATSLEQLVGQRVRTAELIRPACDLIFGFENELVLRVFCIETSEHCNNQNYTLFAPSHTVVVEKRSTVAVANSVQSCLN